MICVASNQSNHQWWEVRHTSGALTDILSQSCFPVWRVMTKNTEDYNYRCHNHWSLSRSVRWKIPGVRTASDSDRVTLAGYCYSSGVTPTEGCELLILFLFQPLWLLIHWVVLDGWIFRQKIPKLQSDIFKVAQKMKYFSIFNWIYFSLNFCFLHISWWHWGCLFTEKETAGVV